MRRGLALALWLALTATSHTAQAPAPPPSPSASFDPALRQKLRALTTEFARAGEAGGVTRLRAVLSELGDRGDELARATRGWEKSLAGAKPSSSSRKALATRLGRELAPLGAQLARLEGPEKQALARLLLTLDSGLPEANEALGRVRAGDGEWLTPEERGWLRGAEDTENHLHAAEALGIEIEAMPSENPALLALCGGGSLVRARGVELHGCLPSERLARILRQGLRAAALSRGILFDSVELPAGFTRRAFLVLESHELYLRAIEEALTSGSLTPDECRKTRDLGLRSYVDSRGWRVYEATSEADMEAVVLWNLLPDWLGYDTQPCLRVGHLNWVCLRFLGTAMPLIAWSEQEPDAAVRARSSAKRTGTFPHGALWRSAQRSLWGTRAWMIAEVRERREPLWARAMLDQDGKIRDAILLKTTLVCELLQDEGRLWEVARATRAKSAPVPAFEEILGEPLPAFEERWRRWLDPPRSVGVLQELEAETPEARASPFEAALLALNHARADALGGQFPEIQVVSLDPDLCRAAERHARYLRLNPEQQHSWPQVHEEYGGAPGFTAEGALAGANSVIALGTEPLAAVRLWLGTFYHRLPLLDPALIGVGFGCSGDIVVLDAGSLRLAPYKEHVVLWPLPGAEDVPLAFSPELPNPVPQADMKDLGYPVTVQLTLADGSSWSDLTLELFLGALEKGTPVDGYFVSPAAPLQPELVPPNAWGFLPKAALKKATLYTARARWNNRERVWSFRTAE